MNYVSLTQAERTIARAFAAAIVKAKSLKLKAKLAKMSRGSTLTSIYLMEIASSQNFGSTWRN